MTKLQIKRAYDNAEPSDGFRVYIDRLWPRGLSHETFHYDLWDKEIAPSAELRTWFHADPDSRWTEFEKRYTDELRVGNAMTDLATKLAKHSAATLLYSSHDHDRNNAIVVLRCLMSMYPHQFH